MTYVFVGPHPDTLADGTPLGLDQIVRKVDLSDPHNQRLVDEGWLIKQDKPDTDTASARTRTQPTKADDDQEKTS